MKNDKEKFKTGLRNSFYFLVVVFTFSFFIFNLKGDLDAGIPASKSPLF